MTSATVAVCVNVVPVSPNRLVAEHHYARAKRRNRERGATALALRGCAPPALPARVTLVRVGNRAWDDDNLAYALKAYRDEVACWLGTDDGPRGRVTWIVGQRHTGERERVLVAPGVWKTRFRGWVEITIEHLVESHNAV